MLAPSAHKLLMIAFLGKALRATLAMLVLMAFYAPRFGTPRGAFIGVILSVVATIGRLAVLAWPDFRRCWP